MDSNFHLRIKDKTLEQDFAQERNKDIVRANLICTVIRVLTLIFGIINQSATLRAFTPTYYIVRFSGILWQTIILVIGYKFPLQTNRFHSALVMPSFSINFIHLSMGLTSFSQLASHLVALEFFLL